ncbi:MMPL family transporter [bacterium]|nr:MMPL family transporter [bacterium]
MSEQRLDRARRYFDWLFRHRWKIHAITLIMVIGGLALATKLKLKPSFSALLPQHLESVQQAQLVSERFGGTGLLLIGIESPNFKANKKFADALALKLEAIEGTKIKSFEYKFSKIARFFEKYGLHYLATSDLFKLKDNLSTTIQQNKDEAFGGFLGFDNLFDDEEPEPKAKPDTISKDEVLGEVDPRIQRFLSYPDNYLASDDGLLVAMGLQAANSSLSLNEAQDLVKTIDEMVKELDPKSFHEEMKVNYAGNVKRAIEEVDTIKKDIMSTALMLMTLIIAVLFLFLWSPRWVFLVLGNLIFAVICTFGFTQLAVGYLNTMTAFLSSLVAGTGINYGIILISRYLEERKSGIEAREALIRSLSSTSLATLLASGTTAASFISLLVANNKGFSQFGIIGGFGVILCWTSCFTILPLWIDLVERRFPKPVKPHPLGPIFHKFGMKTGHFIIRKAPLMASVLLVFTALGATGFKTLWDNPLEYDFSKLQNKTTKGSGASALHWRIQEDVYKSSLVPAVILLESDEQARELCPTVRNLVAKIPEKDKVFEACLSLYDLLPPKAVSEEESKLRRTLRADILQLMGDRWLKFSDSDLAGLLKRIHRNASEKTPSLKDIPDQLKARFIEKSGDLGLIGFIYPDNAKPLEDGRNLLNYTKSFRKIWLPGTETIVSAAGEHFILADLLRGISVDGPRASFFAFLCVLALAFVLTGSVKSGLLMATCMLFGTWWLLCMQGMIELKYNFLNFIALPLTFGIGIDYPINAFVRFRELNYQEFGKVLTTTGTAVILCALTTIIGYSTLLGASNQALVSFAKLALLGELASITSAMVLLPVLIRLVYARKRYKYG